MLHGQPQIHVRNRAQFVLLEWELKGQISDGYWENAVPNNHWRRPCSAEVVIAKDPSRVGKNFSANKENYDFTAKILLDCVGDRMIRYVKIANAFGEEFEGFLEKAKANGYSARYVEYFFDELFQVKLPEHDGEFWESLRKLGRSLPLQELAEKCKASTYDITNLRKDLNELKAIFKVCDTTLS